MSVGPDLTGMLVCPQCRCELSWQADRISCTACGADYPIIDGIPVMLPDPQLAHQDHSHGDHKGRQAAHFDHHLSDEIEISRPHGAPPLHRWLLGEKFRRSIAGLEGLLPGATVLTVCGGSGMDAEFLARKSAWVVSSDISLGAAQRARCRAERFGVAITPLVADVERLPFPDAALDVVYAHDGLHHLEDPHLGIAEMARVAGKAISITEPADAAVTKAAVRVGISEEIEDSGNRVARLRPEAVVEALKETGFEIAHVERYAMFYRHHPGLPSRVLSVPGLFAAARLGMKVANRTVGRWGNKLVVTARRVAEGPGPSR
ncbi:MAG: methyltransferase domain-containing protein [Actinomycetota bacterium]|nr:methyltransferase domain-containing protein [Actinomycetota bacterium]